MPRHWFAHERGILYALDLDAEPPRVLPRVEAAFEEVRRERAGVLAAAMGVPVPAVLDRLGSGRRCFGAWVQGGLAAYGWVSHCVECIGEQEREIRLEPREAYIWDCATRPEHRGRRLYSALLAYMLDTLRAEGIDRVWIGTALDNHPSRRGFLNAGFQPVLTLIYLRAWGVHCALEVGRGDAPAALVSAARRAVTMDHERAWGPLVFGRSQPALPPPCAEVGA